MFSSSNLLTLYLWVAAGTSALAQENLQSCLEEAVNGDQTRARFASSPNYDTNDLDPFNLNLQYQASAVVYPNSTAEVADIVLCANKHSHKVQARGGGRDFINRCV